jgi:hypothetical protein
MTLWSLADGCRLLDIDPKTLHRWLAQAQLPLHPHPSDGRKTALSADHLRQLACLHHRSLPALPEQEHPLPALGAPAPLHGSQLLILPEQLAAMQAQLTALQQQLADLTHLVPQLAHPPALPAAALSQAPAAKRPPTSAPSAPSSPPALAAKPTPPKKPAHVIALVEASHDGQYVVVCPKQGLLALTPESPEWFAWLATQSAFRFIGRQGRFTAHHEVLRVPNGAWRAHRHIRNHSYNLRLGPTQELTIAVLEHAAATLHAHLT